MDSDGKTVLIDFTTTGRGAACYLNRGRNKGIIKHIMLRGNLRGRLNWTNVVVYLMPLPMFLLHLAMEIPVVGALVFGQVKAYNSVAATGKKYIIPVTTLVDKSKRIVHLKLKTMYHYRRIQ